MISIYIKIILQIQINTKPNGYETYTQAKKTIKVKISDVTVTVKHPHGPIMRMIDGLDKDQPVAMSWIYTQQPLQILDAVYQLSHAKNKSDFQKGCSNCCSA
jgi:penicillin amidase